MVPGLEPYAGRLAELETLDPHACLSLLNRWAHDRALHTEAGRPVRFVDAASRPAGGVGGAGSAGSAGGGAGGLAYERGIAASGEVPTRTRGPGVRHDLLNALVWLRFPRTKARLNAIHAAVLEAHGMDSNGVGAARAGVRAGVRGSVRDAVTLFDESGAVWVGEDAGLREALRRLDWHGLFVAGRDRLARSVSVHVVGHGLLHKLQAPYKGVTAHALTLDAPAAVGAGELDALLAARLGAGPLAAGTLCPLPVMGLPGWCAANEDPAFYNDPAVFRAARTRNRCPEEP